MVGTVSIGDWRWVGSGLAARWEGWNIEVEREVNQKPIGENKHASEASLADFAERSEA